MQFDLRKFIATGRQPYHAEFQCDLSAHDYAGARIPQPVTVVFEAETDGDEVRMTLRANASVLHDSCSMPPNGFIGASNGSPSIMSVAVPIMLPSKSATKGCGIVSTHSSQCLYIRSLTMIPLALGRSG